MSFLSLTILVLSPLIAALIVACPLFLKDESKIRKFSIGYGLTLFLYSIAFLFSFDPNKNGLQFVETLKFPAGTNWIQQLGISFSLGVDGISIVLVILTTFLVLLALIISKDSIVKKYKFYYSMIFILTSAVLGVFTSKDLFLFFLFWELELIPMYFLIAIWGSGRKEYSATKFVLYTFAGSIFMLASILAVYFFNHQNTGIYTFDISALIAHSYSYPSIIGSLIFIGFFIGFAVKLPVVPFHTWLPDAHVDAPTPVSMLLAGILLKMGGYGLIRMNLQMLPEAMHILAPVLVILGVINIIYAAIITFAQEDLKKLVAYSSVSHMGIVLLGIGALNAAGVTGAVFQMFAHGVISAGLFLMVGVVYLRTKTRNILELSGLGQVVPKIFYFSMLITLAGLGLPLLIGFAAEALTFIGAFTSYIYIHALSVQHLTIIAVFGIILTASYLLWMLKRVFFGAVSENLKEISDLNFRETLVFASLSIVIISFGLYPACITNIFVPVINAMILR
jgi:NADH-quinone oxidoreductase subunit M